MKSFHLALLAVLVLSAGPARAYVLDEDGSGHPLYWAESPVGYQIVRDNVPDGAEGEAAVQRAFATWSQASANIRYQFEGYADSGVQQNDGRNLVYWVYAGWPYDPVLAALTYRYYDTRDGHLLDADIVFNGERYAWSVDGAGYDIQNSATHEVGHFGGLGHSADAEATMYGKTFGGETKKRTLETDDVAGFEALYGGTREASAAPSLVSASGGGVSGGGGGGGCSIGPSPRVASTGDLTSLALFLGWIARRRRTARA